MNAAELLERTRWPVYFVERGAIDLDAVRLAPGAVVPLKPGHHIVAVRPGIDPPAWLEAWVIVEGDA